MRKTAAVVTTDERPAIQSQRPPAPPARDPLGWALRTVGLLILLAVLATILVALFTVLTLARAPGQLAGGLGDQVGGAAAQASRAVAGAQAALQNATDPNRPPSGLTYDNEFSSLHIVRVGDGLPGGSQYLLSVQAIKRREGAPSGDTALYATIHAELRQPRETRLLGQLIRSDSDGHDYAVYKGESFRIGRALYRVNWISQEDGTLAAATYRNPDAVSAALKFEYD